MYVNSIRAVEVADVPAGVITVTSTAPLPAGLSAVIVVSLTTVTPVAGFVPKSTAVAPVKPVPVIVTEVPPAAGPAVRADARDSRRGRSCRLGQHDIVAIPAVIGDRERRIADRQRGALGKPVEGPDDRCGALDDRELFAVCGREPERGVERALCQINRPGDIELAVAGSRCRAIELHGQRGKLLPFVHRRNSPRNRPVPERSGFRGQRRRPDSPSASPTDIAPTVPVPLKVPPETLIPLPISEPSTWSTPL